MLRQIFTANKKQFLSVVSAGLATAVLVLAGLLLFATPQYSSEIRLLVVQRYTLTDSYTAAKSAEKIGQSLAAVVETSTFLEKVVQTTWVNLNDILELPEEEKRKEWKKKLVAESVGGTSIIQLTAYDADRDRSERLAQAAATALIENGAEYHGASDTVYLEIVDRALTSERPTKPNYVLNTVAAFVLGVLVMVLVIFFRPSTHFDLSMLRHTPVSESKSPVPQPLPEVPAAPVMPAVQEEQTEQVEEVQEPEELNVSEPPKTVEEMPPQKEHVVLHVSNFAPQVAKHKPEPALEGENRSEDVPQVQTPFQHS